MVTKEARVVC